MNFGVRKVHLIVGAVLLATACSTATPPPGPQGNTGEPGKPGAKGDAGDPGGTGSTGRAGYNDYLTRHDPLPGLVLKIVAVGGGTAANGSFKVGDAVTVRFTVATAAGKAVPISELSSSGVHISGPLGKGMHRVVDVQRDFHKFVTENADGTYSYSMALPGKYLAPFNDSPSFGPADGEKTGQNLEIGTYRVAMEANRVYSVEGQQIPDPASAVSDFLLEGASAIEGQEVVSDAACNRCHGRLTMHQGKRVGVGYCITCHTVGAEDKNDPAVEGGTPGVSIDFKVLIHRIHNGSRLPSVNGVTTNLDGTRSYGPGKPFKVANFQNVVKDFSGGVFPVFPDMGSSMPRDLGYSGLPAAAQAKEDAVRAGPIACFMCHGDPDGPGPLPAPAQGSNAFTKPSRAACGSCHDDIDWTWPYTANGQTMPPMASDAPCRGCHPQNAPVDGGVNYLALNFAHLHPLRDSTFDPGFTLDITDVKEAGAANNDGTVDPGEKIDVTFNFKNDAGVGPTPAEFGAFRTVTLFISGPTGNSNFVLRSAIPAAAMAGPQPYVLRAPEDVLFERVGVSTAALETFTTGRTPIWATAPITVYARTGDAGTGTVLAAAAPASQNFADVVDPTGIARDSFIVVDDGAAGLEEYLRVQFVSGSRLWFSQVDTGGYGPWLRNAHPAGASVKRVTLTTKTRAPTDGGSGGDYTLSLGTGQITERTEFGAGNTVVASYTSDFVMPSIFPPSINDSPDINASAGKWVGKPIIDGTYTLGLWSFRTVPYVRQGETNSYLLPALSSPKNFLVGSATKLIPPGVISATSNCEACHNQLIAHGGTRGGPIELCLTCHATAGAEDATQYTAAGAPATPGAQITWRSLLHRIHAGEHIMKKDGMQGFLTVGSGRTPYPTNFTPFTLGVGNFPAMPGGVKACATCHSATVGAACSTSATCGSRDECINLKCVNVSWKQPAARTHPTAALPAARAWRDVCGSCHDHDSAKAHIELNTISGLEACSVCHGPGRELSVEAVHLVR